MIQNVNPQQMYAPSMMPAAPDYTQQLPIPCIAPYPVPQAGVTPVYNSIPYNPVYGNCCQPQQQRAYSPKISTVSIEMNGLQPPQIPGLNDFQAQQAPDPRISNLTFHVQLVSDIQNYQQAQITVFPVTPPEATDQVFWIDHAGYTVATSDNIDDWIAEPSSFSFTLHVSSSQIASEPYLSHR